VGDLGTFFAGRSLVGARSKSHQILFKSLQVVKIGYIPKLDQISRKVLNIKNRFLYRHIEYVRVK
jgi:hypothetical protein